MWFEQMIRSETGCASYMIGSTKSGECLVFDPLWDVAPYLDMAKKRGARIRYVIDSHTHADHVSGARRLAKLGHGELVMPQLAEITYPATRIGHGDTLQMGEVLLEALHTPGHRPEMVSFLVTDRSRSQHPWCILTGDFLMVGDLGRPDLALDGEQGAEMLFDQTLPRLLGLADYVEVYPGHVAGSTCGRVTSGKTITTVGFERRFNWYLQLRDRPLFVAEMNAEQPPRPANVTNIVAINQGRQPLTLGKPHAPAVSPAAAIRAIHDGALLLDVRPPVRFAAGHLPGAYNTPLASPNFEQWVGWLTPPTTPLLLLAEHEADYDLALHKLAFLGLDQRVQGVVQGGNRALAALHRPLRRLRQLSVHQAHERHLRRSHTRRPLHILDVREQAEWDGGHIDNAHHMSVKQLPERMGQLPFAPSDPVAVVCASGVRSSLAASLLLRHGYQQVYSVAGGMNAWREADLPVVECADGEACAIAHRRPKPLRPTVRPAPAAAPPPSSIDLPYWMEAAPQVTAGA